MTRLFAAELLKLSTLRSTWGFSLVALGLAGVVTAGNIGGKSQEGRLDPEFQSQLVLDAAFPAVVLSLLLGMVLVTNEFRHGTITRSLLVTPRRTRLLAAKLLAGAAAGVGLTLVGLIVTGLIAAVWLGSLDVPLDAGEAASGIWYAFLGVVLAGVLGAAVGGFVHSQVGALVGALVWIFIAEPLIWVVFGLLDLDSVADYMPAASILGVADTSGDGLSSMASVGMGLVWIALAAVLATFRTTRRDIT
jgi:ABC-2 type transport system permease protein